MTPTHVTVPSTSSQERKYHESVGPFSGASSESPRLLCCKTLVGKGAPSLVGDFSHSGVPFDEQPEMKNVRANGATKTLPAKAQAAVGEGGPVHVV